MKAAPRAFRDETLARTSFSSEELPSLFNQRNYTSIPGLSLEGKPFSGLGGKRGDPRMEEKQVLFIKHFSFFWIVPNLGQTAWLICNYTYSWRYSRWVPGDHDKLAIAIKGACKFWASQVCTSSVDTIHCSLRVQHYA